VHAECVHVLSLIILVGLDWGVPGPQDPPPLGYAAVLRHLASPAMRLKKNAALSTSRQN